MTQTYWEDHELLKKISTNVIKLQDESDETIRKVTDDLMSQLWLQIFSDFCSNLVFNLRLFSQPFD